MGKSSKTDRKFARLKAITWVISTLTVLGTGMHVSQKKYISNWLAKSRIHCLRRPLKEQTVGQKFHAPSRRRKRRRRDLKIFSDTIENLEKLLMKEEKMEDRN